MVDEEPETHGIANGDCWKLHFLHKLFFNFDNNRVLQVALHYLRCLINGHSNTSNNDEYPCDSEIKLFETCQLKMRNLRNLF